MHMHRTLGGLACLYIAWFGSADAVAEPPSPPRAHPRELGHVRWLRGFDAAVETARRDKKPLLVLFDEVPGCATCTGYGDNVLRHPLIIEAAETLFVPVAIYNNVPGDDERTLKLFKEPAWNNPVVRVLDADRKDVVARLDGDYSVGGLASRMIAALRKRELTVPAYLDLLAEETIARARATERAVFAMHCFWEGEAKLGDVGGVIATQPGFVAGQEVVEVEFDPSRVKYAALLDAARSMQCATRAFCRSDAQHKVAVERIGKDAIRSDEPIRPDNEPKYYLAQTALKFVPMTELQACRVNAAVGRDRDPNKFLSPRQIKLFETIKAHPSADWSNAVGASDLVAAWAKASVMARRLSNDR